MELGQLHINKYSLTHTHTYDSKGHDGKPLKLSELNMVQYFMRKTAGLTQFESFTFYALERNTLLVRHQQ